ncbi:dynamin family protein [Streptomyces caatingaensis]|uniref:Dynamin n=1 Tax=Streptomyces caatingaensis TaxID=1678637 RepID=A0A0K9XKL0_9ACTN|nr:dynamin family protein [Streptomyces caatingaensis]KNB53843.1 hypothetical protein AC230_04435 [Streptomyces caatingaensis]
MNGYGIFEEHRQSLLALIGRLRPVLEAVNVEANTERLRVIQERVESDTFKVMFVGEFKRGKSTVINALLGAEVLPTDILPCTAIVNEVKWGAERRARLHPMPTAGKDAPDRPLDIPVEKLAEHVTIQDGDDGGPRPNPYERAEVFWPLPLCENHVEIIDSPGLNEAPERERLTLGYLDRADALVMVLLTTAPLSLSEQTFLDVHVAARGHEDAFFLFTRIDDVPPNRRDAVVESVRNRLAPYHPRDDRVFFVNARDALEGRVRGSGADGRGATGFPPFEQALERFLVRDRGRAKVLVPVLRLQNVVTAARRDIELQQGMLRRTSAGLRREYELQQVPLRQVAQRRDAILGRVDSHLRDVLDEVGAMARRFYRGTADAVEEWARELPLENRLKGLNPFTRTARVEALEEELSAKLKARVQEASAAWQRDELQVFLEERVLALEAQIETDLTELVERVDGIRYELAAVPRRERPGAVAGGVERVVAAGLGTVLGGPGMGLAGANFGFKGVTRAVLPTVAVAVVGAAVGLAALPFSLAVLAANLVSGSLATSRLEQELKEKAAQDCADALRDRTDRIVTELSATVREQLDKVREIVAEGIEGELRSVRQEVENALERLESGEAEREATLAELSRQGSVLNDLDEILAELVAAVAI